MSLRPNPLSPSAHATLKSKGERFADVLLQFNDRYPNYAISPVDVRNGDEVDLARMTEVLQRTGFLKEGETPPVESIPHIAEGLRKRYAARGR
jgi:hypothetical protein